MKKTFSHLLRRQGVGRLALVSLVLLLAASFGCDGGCGGSGSIPGSADARVEDMAQHLPADTPAAMVVGDLKGMRTSLETARDTLGDTVPMSALLEEQAKNELGIDLFDAKSWEKSGIAADSGLTLSVVGKRPVLVTYVADKQKFEKAFADQLKKSMEIEGMTKSEKSGDTQVKVLGKDAKTVAWAYDGKLVVVAFPESEGVEDIASTQEAKDAKKLAADLTGLEEAKSLATNDGYKKFNKALASNQAMALFVNAKKTMTDERLAGITQGADPMSKATVTWMQKNIDAMGLSMNVEGNTLKVRAWGGLPPKVVKRAKEIMTPPAKSPIKNFATVNTMMGLRTSVDMPKLWAFYKETLPKAERDKLMANLEKAAKQGKLDIEKDVINKMTGNLGVVFYGIDQSVIEQSGGNVMQALMMQPTKLLAVLVPVQFKDKASLEKVVGALTEMGGGAVTRSTVKDGVDVLKMKNVTKPRGAFYIKDNLLVYATGAFSDDSVVEYITGKRDEKNLADSDKLDLGKDFATQEKYNGLYVNFVRAQGQLGDLLAKAAPQALTFMKKVEEASLTTEVSDTGAYLDLTVDLTPKAAKDGADKKGEGKSE